MTAPALKLFQCQSVDSICRLCFMERDQLELIFHADREEYCSQLIEKLTSLKIYNVPNAPSSLCTDCKSTLEAFDAFREMCITNDLVFKETFCSGAIPEELPPAGEIKVENIEDQHKNMVIIQDGNTSTSSEILDVKNTSDTSVTKLVVDNFEIKVHDMDPSMAADVPIVAMVNIPMTNGEDIESSLTDDHATLNIAGHQIDIDSSVESDDSMEPEIYDDSARSLANENIGMSPTIEEVLRDNHKYMCKICDINVSKLHKMTHLNVRLFRCFFCSTDFERFNYLSKHTTKWHKGKKANAPINTGHNNVSIDESNAAVAGPSTVALGGYEFIISEKDDIQPDSNDKNEVEEQNLMASSNDKSLISDYRAFSCKICKKYATKLHTITHKAEGLFQCYLCPKTFDKMKNCSKHIKCHMDKQRNLPSQASNNVNLIYSCKICKQRVTKVHMKTHKAKGLYVCYICRKKFENVRDMNQHIKYHVQVRKRIKQEQHASSQPTDNGNKRPAPYEHTCNVCMKYATKMHATTHINVGVFECYICFRKFDKFDYVSRHIKLHIKKGQKTAKMYARQVERALQSYQVDEPTACASSNLTNYEPSSENHIDLDAAHVKQEDPDVNIVEPPAVQIDIDSSVEDEDDDVQVVESGNEFSQDLNSFMFTCNICNSNPSKLHVMTHKAEGVFQCPVCPKVSTRFINITQHIRCHKGEIWLQSLLE